jgi:hypothetical protein
MASGSFPLRLAGAMLVLAVAACSGPPWVTAVSPNLVALRWYTDQTPVAVAGAVAGLQCATSDKVAVLVADEQSGGAQMAQYDCR